MRKLFLGVLFAVMMFGVMGMASADFTGTFSNPVTSNFYKGTVNVAFTNTAGLNGLNLEYKSGTDCNVLTGTWNTLTTFGNNVGSYNWATNTVSDGTYCLILQAGSGTTFATSGVFTIDNSVPTAVISVSGNAVPSSSLTFNGTGSTDTGSGIANYAWTFGDEGVATTAIANHAYTTVGDKTVTLIVTDFAGTQSIAATYTVHVTQPKAVIVESGNNVTGETLGFDGSLSTFTVGHAITNYAWTFGDNGIASGTSVSHAYSQPGTYQITLTVTDNVGNYNTVILPLNVIPIPYSGTFSYDAVIKGVQNLSGNVPTGTLTPTSVTGCTTLSGAPSGLVVGVSGNTCTLTWTNILYNQEGIYTFPVRATDGTTIKYFSVTVNAYAWMIPLSAGWNVFSIPLMPNDPSLTGVLGNIQSSISSSGNSIFQYDAVGGTWDKSTSTLSGGSLTQIVPGYGYWINMANPATLKGFGYINPTGGQVLSASVVNGWNLIGQYGLGALLPGDALFSLTSGGTQYWQTVYDINAKSTLNPATDTMSRYNGYWMSVGPLSGIQNGEIQYFASTAAINSITP